MTISGECPDVLEETVTGWHERMKVLMDGYQAQDVWNTDETGWGVFIEYFRVKP